MRTRDGKKVDIETAQAALYDPRSYLAKNVPQRMAIISAGVIMNLIFAFVVAVIAFQLGVRQLACAVGGVVPGDAAWQADLQVGDKIVRINDRPAVQFGELKSNVSLGDLERGVPMVIERPGSDETESLTLIPEKGPDALMPTVGIIPPRTNKITSLENMAEYLTPGSPAAAAEPPLAPRDTILKVGDVTIENQAELYTQLALHADEPLTFTIARKAEQKEGEPEKTAEPEIVEITMPPNPMRRFGLIMTMGSIAAVQDDSPAKTAGIRPKDVLLKVDGKPVGDPMTLPARLAKRAGETISVTVRRPGVSEPVEIKDVVLRSVPRIENAFSEGNPLAVSVLGVAYDVIAKIADVVPDSPAAKAGVKRGQVVESAVVKVMTKPSGTGGKQKVKRKDKFKFGEKNAKLAGDDGERSMGRFRRKSRLHGLRQEDHDGCRTVFGCFRSRSGIQRRTRTGHLHPKGEVPAGSLGSWRFGNAHRRRSGNRLHSEDRESDIAEGVFRPH